MADTKITALTAISTVDPAIDVLPIVDVSDTTMAASGTTKKITSNQILGAGGTATLASATITGAATVGTTLGVTGATNLSGALTVSTGANATPLTLTCSNAAGTTFNVANTGGAGTHSFGGYNAIVGGGNATDLVINSAGQTIIRTGSTNVATFTTAGNLSLPTGNVVMATSGKGIDFSATAGTGTSELLNDYEEGTWTGTLIGGTTNPAVLVAATGKYTKIGRQVTVAIYFFNADTTGYAGSVSIQGLPFTEDGTRAVGTAAFFNFDFNGGTGPFVDISGATMFFQTQLTNSNWRDINHTAGVGRYLRATLTYFV